MSAMTLGTVVRSFFEDYLIRQKGLSAATIKSYRDGLRLFLLFVVGDCGHKITNLAISDLTAERVTHFLNELELKRRNHICTRNQRLAGLRCFFDYLASREPEILNEAERVAAIPRKRVALPVTSFLERDEIEALFANLPKQGRFALRDHVLLLFLYNTGARVQETVELRVANLELSNPPRVRLHGKGDKWRICPLWKETSQSLTDLLKQTGAINQPDQPVFISLRGQPLTRFGIYKIVRKHTKNLAKEGSSSSRQISPHSIRHTTAVHLLESGVEVNVIRAWLGHVSLETTNRYAEMTLRMKAEALAQCEPPVQPSEKSLRKLRWRDDAELLKWLDSL
ncbi:MAG: tyrosine-type recombinase/integrase [Gammaproteobacteria bacterium]